MIIKFMLSFSDYLTYHLYSASKSKTVKDSRRKSWLVRSGALLLLGAACYKADVNTAIFFVLGGVFCLIFYPFFQRRSYENLYKKFILENYGNIAGKEFTTIDFQSEYIIVQRPSFEQKIYISEICEINEIGTHFFIKINTPVSLIIPKSAIENNSFGNTLIKLFNNPNIVISKELDWKWK